MVELPPLEPSELGALPVFPLPTAVLFPGATLPLHFFEKRYRALMEHCVSQGPMAMAVARLKPGFEHDYERHPPIYEIAGAGRIVDWRRLPDGRFDVLLHGVERVRLDEQARPDHTFRVAGATEVADRSPHPEAVQAELSLVLGTAATLSAVLRERHPTFELGLKPGATPGRIADQLADRLVTDADRRQRLLETPDVKVRLALVHETVIDLLARVRADPRLAN